MNSILYAYPLVIGSRTSLAVDTQKTYFIYDSGPLAVF